MKNIFKDECMVNELKYNHDAINKNIINSGYWVGNYFNYFNLNFNHNDWVVLKNTWNDLPQDQFMADGGKYRFRRFSEIIYDTSLDNFIIKPHSFFFQDKYLNKLNGGVNRRFECITPYVIFHPIMKDMIRGYSEIFKKTVSSRYWKIFFHQVRIQATSSLEGKPAPEGIHKDGVNFSTLFCVNRTPSSDGAINIMYDNEKNEIEKVTLNRFGDLVIFDDSKVFHSVTPLQVQEGEKEAHRDMLFLEFTAMGNTNE